ncbi:MAG: hypothetical protein B7X04_00010 [Parcubacteria group bacterium 21-54-25]|nr:MAG: hypothetical protein B7X04_00010 [Parcubacteria group bacterium 21-54-25]HQU08171.1 hypothetical protein [Candidatus Paceibacterota bacterium]
MAIRKRNTDLLIKEQLLPEFSFIGYCDDDNANKYSTSKRYLDSQFIHAAIDEGLLTPLYSAEGLARQPDGSQKIGMVDYYSPLQFYIVTELRLNAVQNGVLWSPDSIDWYPDKPMEERPRYVAWGSGMAFGARKKDDPGRNKTDDFLFNPYAFTSQFDDFLRFIHTTPLKDRYAVTDEDIDIFARAPVFDHDLSKIPSLPEELKKYGLDAKKLEILRANVGRAAAVIDPLELWYYYVKRHPGQRKSLLKGDAHVAQRLYRLYDLITDVWERVTGETPKPFLEFTQGELISGYLTPRVEYLHGTDVQAMRHSIVGFKNWVGVRGNGKYVTPQIQEALTTITAELDEYEKRYGDRSYGGSYRVRKDGGIRYDQLDDVSKQLFDQWRKQSRDEEDWSIIESIIDHRLDEIQRSLLTVYRGVHSQLNAITLDAWEAHKNIGHHFWPKHAGLPRNEAMALLQQESKKLMDHAKKSQEKEREFGRALSGIGLAFCKVCRTRPVQLHVDSNRHGFESQPSICDECVREKKEAPDNIKNAEWRCPNCDSVICKFVHGNTLSGRMLNTAPFIIELKYGSLSISAKCPGCKQDLDRQVEWGWLP